MGQISVLVLVANSERTLARTLESVKGFDEVVVIDSGSRDKSEQIGKEYGVKWIVHPFEGFSEQRNFAIEQASHEWCLFVDSDEAVTPRLIEELYGEISKTLPLYPLYRIKRVEYLLNKEIQTGLGGPTYQERFFQKNRVRYAGKIHEYPLIDGAKPSLESSLVGYLADQATLLHDPDNSAEMMLEKIGKYSVLKAKEKYGQGRRTNGVMVFFTFSLVFIKAFWKCRREGKRGFITSLLESLHCTMVKLLIYEYQISSSQKSKPQGHD